MLWSGGHLVSKLDPCAQLLRALLSRAPHSPILRARLSRLRRPLCTATVKVVEAASRWRSLRPEVPPGLTGRPSGVTVHWQLSARPPLPRSRVPPRSEPRSRACPDRGSADRSPDSDRRGRDTEQLEDQAEPGGSESGGWGDWLAA